ncbi:FRIGIDA-like protein 3 [Prosopis cineraria]|uniref:FRIGIDA-like protein 3 n=1 Tax=Prosopis cineraria TaxID=364024 RepID=UPI00240EDBC4|nr:FRIGIDA-like protein 3 [Prosopis cineraria]
MNAVMEQGKENDASSLIEQLGRAFLELEARKDALEGNIQWDEIKQHFHGLEIALKKKLEELESKERDYEKKEGEVRTQLAEREEEVASKEQDLLDRVQELKDTAVAAIVEARGSHQATSLESVDEGENKDNKVRSSFGDENSQEDDFPCRLGENEVKPRPELTHFCEQMDARGLLNYIVDNKKNISVFREELSIALESATEPAHMVLDSLEGFYPTNETTQLGDKMDAALQGMRKSFIIIMEALATLLARAEPDTDHLLNPQTKQQAKAIADEWKPKLAKVTDAANRNSLEAEAFLQLLATFRIASEFDEEELCKLVLAIAQHRRAPELCRSLGLTHKVPDLVELLITDGKQIAAVHFIQAFQLKERFAPVPLLKAYLKDLRRNSQGKVGGSVAGEKDDANAQELAALKAVIKCVEEYNLESDYPLDPLQRRVAQLDKLKTDRKRGGESSKRQQPKKPKANGGYFTFRPSAAGSAAASTILGRRLPPVRGAYSGIPGQYPHASAITYGYDYQVPGQSIYSQQVNDQRLPFYPHDDRVAAPSNYGSYMGGSSGVQSSHQPYM